MLRKLIAIGVLCLGALAFAPVAMADPAPDICMLDNAPSASVAYDVAPAAPACSIDVMAVQSLAALSPGGDEGEAAGPCSTPALKAPGFASSRLHFDPGRCLG